MKTVKKIWFRDISNATNYVSMLKKYKLTIKQERFCKLYILHIDYIWNWTKSYIKAFKNNKCDNKGYNTARTESSRLLTKANILTYMKDLLETNWLSDEFIDKQLFFLIKQNQNLSIKILAIRYYNEIKGRLKKKTEFNNWNHTEFLEKLRDYINSKKFT